MEAIDKFMSENWMIVLCIAPILTGLVVTVAGDWTKKLFTDGIKYERVRQRVSAFITMSMLKSWIIGSFISYLHNPGLLEATVTGFLVGLHTAMGYIVRDTELYEFSNERVDRMAKIWKEVKDSTDNK